MISFANLLRDLRMRTPLRRLSPAFHRYEYMFSPAQLAFLLRCLDETVDCPGAVVEIGCATGRTTVFLNRHLDDISPHRDYVCIDTFSGFLGDDVDFEVRERHQRRELLDGFRVNRRAWFDRNLRDNRIERVRTYRADIKRFDLARVAPAIAFALIDVDLYRPVKAALDLVYPLLAPGGIIVVDDVQVGGPFDGAAAAYDELLTARGLTGEKRLGKLGILRR